MHVTRQHSYAAVVLHLDHHHQVVAASPPSLCGVTNPAALAGKVVIFTTGGCDPSVKAANLAQAGAAAGEWQPLHVAWWMCTAWVCTLQSADSFSTGCQPSSVKVAVTLQLLTLG